MNYQKGFAISILGIALSSSAFALSGSHREDRDHDRREHPVAVAHRDHNHDRDDHRGWDKGKKEGWRKGHVPPGQAKKHRRELEREHHYRAEHRRRDHDRDHRYVAAHKPMPTKSTPRPVTQDDRNRSWGDNVRARKADIQQQQAQQQGPYIKH